VDSAGHGWRELFTKLIISCQIINFSNQPIGRWMASAIAQISSGGSLAAEKVWEAYDPEIAIAIEFNDWVAHKPNLPV
jgi:hypothetical protein